MHYYLNSQGGKSMKEITLNNLCNSMEVPFVDGEQRSPQDILKETAEVQFFIAIKSEDPDVLDVLATSPNALIRLKVACNHHTRIKTLRNLRNDTSFAVKSLALDNLISMERKGLVR